MSYNYGGGGAGGNDGGGFMGGSQSGSQDGNSKTHGKDTLRPVTIKQLIDATRPRPDAEFLIDSTEISTITLVGQIQSVQAQHTNTTYKIDDGTGLIEIKQWTDTDAAEDPNHPANLKKHELVEGKYMRVAGKLKDFNGKRHVGSHMIRAVDDYNEISYHLLECAVVHLYFTRGPPGDAATKMEGGGDGGMFVDNDSGPTEGFQGKKIDSSRLKGTSKRVFTLLEQTPQGNEGLHVSLIAQKLGISQSEVFKAGDELLADGIIYTTVDDETWAVLEM